MPPEGSGVITPYINESGDFWIERGVASWPVIQHEAASWAREIGDWDSVSKYVGLVVDVRVSDEREDPHDEDMEDPEEAEARDMPVCAGCCRTITAYHFRSEEPAWMR